MRFLSSWKPSHTYLSVVAASHWTLSVPTLSFATNDQNKTTGPSLDCPAAHTCDQSIHPSHLPTHTASFSALDQSARGKAAATRNTELESLRKQLREAAQQKKASDASHTLALHASFRTVTHLHHLSNQVTETALHTQQRHDAALETANTRGNAQLKDNETLRAQYSQMQAYLSNQQQQQQQQQYQ